MKTVNFVHNYNAYNMKYTPYIFYYPSLYDLQQNILKIYSIMPKKRDYKYKDIDLKSRVNYLLNI